MKSPYDILGVKPSATANEIRTAYRRLAKLKHPDANPGVAGAADEFAALSTAYEVVSDPEKRARYDRGEIDATGAEVPPRRPSYGEFDPSDLEEMLRGAGRRGRGGFAMRGDNVTYTLTVSFMDAALGTVRRLSLPDGKTLDVTIPAGHRDGQALRLRGQGMPGFGGGPPGDALIEVTVAPHKFFRREGDDIVLEVPVTLQEAMLGGTIEVPTLTGKVSLKVPARSGPGTRMRLRGRGIGAGHQFVVLSLVLPREEEEALEAFLREWVPEHPQEPRKGMVE